MGSKIVTASADKTARIYSTMTGSCIGVLEGKFINLGHIEEVSKAVFNSKGNKILTCSADNTAIIWDGENMGNKL